MYMCMYVYIVLLLYGLRLQYVKIIPSMKYFVSCNNSYFPCVTTYQIRTSYGLKFVYFPGIVLYSDVERSDGHTPVQLAEEKGRRPYSGERKRRYTEIVDMLNKYKGKVLYCEWLYMIISYISFVQYHLF